jgi:hypothetical protein
MLTETGEGAAGAAVSLLALRSLLTALRAGGG